jgi:hypothetical protein
LPPADAAGEASLFRALMLGPDTATPHGVPTTWDWAHHPDVTEPTNGAMAAMTAWGQIYAEAGVREPPRGSVRVEVSHIRSFIWSNSQRRWALVQDSLSADGAHYFEDFRGNRSVPADLMTEPDGGTSVGMIPGFNFHFWPMTGRAGLLPGDVGAVITAYEARLIGPSAAHARYLANAGGDWWRTTSAPYEGSSTNANNAGIGEGRFVQLCSSWSTIAFYTGGP